MPTDVETGAAGAEARSADQVSGLDALELGPRREKGQLGRRLWAGTWPKLLAIAIVIAIWEIVFQDHLLLDWRTSLDNVMLQVEFRELDRRQYLPRARELLKSVGLADFEGKRPWELSGGMRQRVSVCRALVHDPPLLFMDEPFGALDALTREQMRIDLEKLWLGTGKTVVFITHSISEAVLLSDRVLVFSARPGTILENVEIELERPRSVKASDTPAFRRYSEQILEAFHQTGVLRY